MSQNHSMQFDGLDDSVILDENYTFQATDAFSVEAWVSHDNQGVIQQIVAKLGADSNTYRGWGFQILSNGRISGYVSSEFFVDYRLVRGTTLLLPNTWYHVAMTYDGNGEISLFVDGQPDPIESREDDGVLTDIATSAPARIGAFGEIGLLEEPYRGLIDDVRIWDGVRTAQEIETNYLTELSGNEAGLVGYYKMDDVNSSCDVQDCSINQIHGTRDGLLGSEGIPQFSNEIPTITNVECGVTQDCTLAIATEQILEIVLSPNPARDVISIVGMEDENFRVAICDMLGKILIDTTTNAQTIDVSELAQGVYFASFYVQKKQITKRFIKK